MENLEKPQNQVEMIEILKSKISRLRIELILAQRETELWKRSADLTVLPLVSRNQKAMKTLKCTVAG